MARALRYNFIVGLVGLSAALAAAGGWKYARASAPVSGPIVLISVDGLRADHLSAYGHPGTHTPALDSLAAGGVLFEHAFSHVPESLPAHAAIMTGRLPFETGVRDAVGFLVKDDEKLLPEILHDRGYATAGIVSTLELRSATGISQGFDRFDDKMAPAPAGAALSSVDRPSPESESAAEQWLNSAHTERAFLFLQLALRRTGESTAYDDAVAAVDQTIGRFVRYLKTHQLYDQSTIVVVGTYGEGLGDHHEQTHGLFVYDDALHVPLIIKQATGEGAGVRVADLVQQIDLMPTILDFAKAPIPGNLRGSSLKPLLDGTGHLTARDIYSESLYGYYHFGWAPLRTVTDGSYRYIEAPVEELYDLSGDPDERTNLADEPAQAQELARLKNKVAVLARNRTIAAPGPIAGADRDRLSALGYVGEQDEWSADADPIDPKDKAPVVEGYRAAVGLAFIEQWNEAAQALQMILRSEPQRVDLWNDVAAFALRTGRLDTAIDAYKRIAALRPDDKQTSARLNQIKAFADARALFGRQRYTAALPIFVETIDDLGRTNGRPIAGLHYYAGETLARLDQPDAAQTELTKELDEFPDNLKARAELARLPPSNK